MSNDGALVPVPVRPQSWVGRNKGLAIGLGCLAFFMLGGLFVGGILTVVGVAMRASDPYQLAVATATHDPSVVAELGAPVKPGWLTTGQINVAGPSGHAGLAIPIYGSRASGKINVCAEKAHGKWTFSCLSVDVPGRPKAINLLAVVPMP